MPTTEPNRQSPGPPRPYFRAVIEGLAAAITAFVLIYLCMAVVHVRGVGALNDEVRASLIRTAQTAAAFLDGDRHLAYRHGSEATDPEIAAAVAPLRAMLQARPDLRYIYTVVKDEGRLHYVLNATPPGDLDGDGVDDQEGLGRAHRTPRHALLAALREGRPQADTAPMQDATGTFLSGYAPMYDRTGHHVGVVGVDLNADRMLLRMSAMRKAMLWGIFTALITSLGLGLATGATRMLVLRARVQRRAHVAALQWREREYRLLVESSPDAIFRLDAEGRFRFISAGDCQPIIARAGDLPGQPFEALGIVPAEASLWHARIHAAATEGQPTEGEVMLPEDGFILNIRLVAEEVEPGAPPSVLGIARDITEHRRIERDYRQIFERMLDGFALHEIICDPDGRPTDYRFLAINPAFERLTGLKASDLVGRTVRQALPATESEWIETYGAIALGAPPREFERYSRELGRYFEVSAYSPAPGQFACLFTDVTQRQRAQEALREREERYRVLVNALTDALVVHALEPDGVGGRIIEVNDQACDLYGYSREGLMGLRIDDLFPPEVDTRRIEAYTLLRQGQDVAYDALQVTGDQRRLEVEIHSGAIRLGDEQAVMLLVRDVTERKRLASENQKVQEQIQHVQKLEGLGLLAGGIAHDFNNLLMAILGNADLALEDMTSGVPGRDNVREIKTISMKAADLCRQMLAYSGKGKFVVEPILLSGLIEEMSHLLTVSVSKKALLKYQLTPALPPIMADASQLRQVVMNLVINASEAIGERSGVIAVTTGAVECDEAYLRTTFLGLSKPGVYVCLEVSDTGCGMDAATKARMFDPFYTSKFTGRGLGLAAVLGIVRGHRGAIKVYSEPGQGTSFKVYFPSDTDAVAVKRPPRSEDADWRGEGLILLVDDEESLVVIGKKMLERSGFQVITAANGREAVDVFTAQSGSLRAVVMDLTMPHMDGDAAFRHMHTINPQVPVVLASGYNEQELAQRLAGRGAAAYLQKPYSRQDLIRALQRALGMAAPSA